MAKRTIRPLRNRETFHPERQARTFRFTVRAPCPLSDVDSQYPRPRGRFTAIKRGFRATFVLGPGMDGRLLADWNRHEYIGKKVTPNQ